MKGDARKDEGGRARSVTNGSVSFAAERTATIAPVPENILEIEKSR